MAPTLIICRCGRRKPTPRRRSGVLFRGMCAQSIEPESPGGYQVSKKSSEDHPGDDPAPTRRVVNASGTRLMGGNWTFAVGASSPLPGDSGPEQANCSKSQYGACHHQSANGPDTPPFIHVTMFT
jgi:hypothetical protein